MEIESRKLSILQVVSQLQNNQVLLQIEKILQEQAEELFNIVRAKQTEQLLGIPQKPRRIKTNLEQLAREQNYKPRKHLFIGALEQDDLSFNDLCKMIGK